MPIMIHDINNMKIDKEENIKKILIEIENHLIENYDVKEKLLEKETHLVENKLENKEKISKTGKSLFF